MRYLIPTSADATTLAETLRNTVNAKAFHGHEPGGALVLSTA